MASQNNIIIVINEGSKNAKYLKFGIDSIKKGGVLFSFNECDDVVIYNESRYFDVKIESLDDNDDFETISIFSSEKINKRDNPRVPLFYQIQFVNTETKAIKIAYFEVKPLTALNINFYEFMVNALKSFNENLLFDQTKKKDIYSKGELFSSFNEPNFLYKSDEDFNAVISSIARLKNDLNFNLDKMIVRKSAYKKQDERTIIKNSLNAINNKIYSSTKIKKYDTRENRYLLKILKEIVTNIKGNLFSVNERNKELLISINDKNNTLNNIYMRDEAKDRLIQDITTKDKSYKRNVHAIENMHRVLYSLNDLISFLTFEGVKNDLTSQITRTFLTKKSYLFFYKNIYENFTLRKNSPNFLKNVDGNSIYNTSKLFEHFLLYSFDNALMKLNFSKYGSTDLVTFDPFCDNKEFIYYNDKLIVKIDYEKEIKKIDDKNENDFYLFRGSHNSPDFLISIFDKENRLLYAAVIDAKCRKEISLNRYLNDSKQNIAIKDYLEIIYLKEDESYLEGHCINDLIYIYPDDEEKRIKDNLYGFYLFSKIMNKDNNEIIKLFGDMCNKAIANL